MDREQRRRSSSIEPQAAAVTDHYVSRIRDERLRRPLSGFLDGILSQRLPHLAGVAISVISSEDGKEVNLHALVTPQGLEDKTQQTQTAVIGRFGSLLDQLRTEGSFQTCSLSFPHYNGQTDEELKEQIETYEDLYLGGTIGELQEFTVLRFS